VGTDPRSVVFGRGCPFSPRCRAVVDQRTTDRWVLSRIAASGQRGPRGTRPILVLSDGKTSAPDRVTGRADQRFAIECPVNTSNPPVLV